MVAAAAPAVALIALVAGMLVAEAAGWPLVWFETPMTMAEAAGLRDPATVLAKIRQGEDPNRRVQVRAGVFSDHPAMLTPLEAAVLGRRLDVIQLLVANGAVVDAGNRAVLACRARTAGQEEIVEYFSAALPVAADGGRIELSCDGVRTIEF
jgi:hypothetical protein